MERIFCCIKRSSNSNLTSFQRGSWGSCRRMTAINPYADPFSGKVDSQYTAEKVSSSSPASNPRHLISLLSSVKRISQQYAQCSLYAEQNLALRKLERRFRRGIAWRTVVDLLSYYSCSTNGGQQQLKKSRLSSLCLSRPSDLPISHP